MIVQCPSGGIIVGTLITTEKDIAVVIPDMFFENLVGRKCCRTVSTRQFWFFSSVPRLVNQERIFTIKTYLLKTNKLNQSLFLDENKIGITHSAGGAFE